MKKSYIVWYFLSQHALFIIPYHYHLKLSQGSLDFCLCLLETQVTYVLPQKGSLHVPVFGQNLSSHEERLQVQLLGSCFKFVLFWSRFLRSIRMAASWSKIIICLGMEALNGSCQRGSRHSKQWS